jgi:hypothetical protein
MPLKSSLPNCERDAVFRERKALGYLKSVARWIDKVIRPGLSGRPESPSSISSPDYATPVRWKTRTTAPSGCFSRCRGRPWPSWPGGCELAKHFECQDLDHLTLGHAITSVSLDHTLELGFQLFNAYSWPIQRSASSSCHGWLEVWLTTLAGPLAAAGLVLHGWLARRPATRCRCSVGARRSGHPEIFGSGYRGILSSGSQGARATGGLSHRLHQDRR